MANETLKFRQTPQLLTSTGDAFLQGECYDDAIDCYYRALMREKEKPDEIMTRLGKAYTVIGDNEQAVKWYIRAIRANKRNRDIYPGIVEACANVGFDMRESAMYYFTLGRRFGICDESEVEAINELTDYCEQIEDLADPRRFELDLMTGLHGAMQIDRAKHLLRENAYPAAYTVLNTVSDEDPYYNLARRMILRIDVEYEHYEKAVSIACELLKKDPDDNVALIYGAAAYGGLGDKKTRDELFAKVDIDSCAKNGDDLETAAHIAWETGNYDMAKRCLILLERLLPWDREVLLWLALVNANLADDDDAHYYMIKVSRLYPDDSAIKYYAERLEAGDRNFEMLDCIPDPEAAKREDTLDEWMAKLATIEAVKDGLDKDETMREYLDWLFEDGDIELQRDIGSFLAQSPDFKEYLEKVLIDPFIVDDVKKDILLEMLDTRENFKVCVAVGRLYREFNYNPPKQLCARAHGLYRRALVALTFYCDGFISDIDYIFRVCDEYISGMGEAEDEDTETALAAAICYLGNSTREGLDKKEYIDIFRCSDDLFEKFAASGLKDIDDMRCPNLPDVTRRIGR